jgi:hypothetical protein
VVVNKLREAQQEREGGKRLLVIDPRSAPVSGRIPPVVEQDREAYVAAPDRLGLLRVVRINGG